MLTIPLVNQERTKDALIFTDDLENLPDQKEIDDLKFGQYVIESQWLGNTPCIITTIQAFDTNLPLPLSDLVRLYEDVFIIPIKHWSMFDQLNTCLINKSMLELVCDPKTVIPTLKIKAAQDLLALRDAHNPVFAIVGVKIETDHEAAQNTESG